MCATPCPCIHVQRVIPIPYHFTFDARNFAVLSKPTDCIARIFIARLFSWDMHVEATIINSVRNPCLNEPIKLFDSFLLKLIVLIDHPNIEAVRDLRVALYIYMRGYIYIYFWRTLKIIFNTNRLVSFFFWF